MNLAAALILYAGTVYGWSWVVTKARVTASLRERLKDVAVMGELLHCIVCTSFWTALVLVLFIRPSGLLGILVPTSGLDALVLVGFATATTWVAARSIGDAD